MRAVGVSDFFVLLLAPGPIPAARAVALGGLAAFVAATLPAAFATATGLGTALTSLAPTAAARPVVARFSAATGTAAAVLGVGLRLGPVPVATGFAATVLAFAAAAMRYRSVAAARASARFTAFAASVFAFAVSAIGLS